LKKILITGWSGFLGLNLTRLLLDSGYQVIGFSRNDPVPHLGIINHPAFLFIRGNLVNNAHLETIPEIDCMVHLAGNVSANYSIKNCREDFENNVIATFNILEYCRKRSNVTLIYASTAKIYPLADLVKHTPYGTSKYVADCYAQEYILTYNIPIIINRFVTFYGPRQYNFSEPDRSWINWFIEANITGKPIVLAGQGDQIRDPLFIGDAAELVKIQIENPAMVGNIYDVGAGTDNSITPSQVVEQIVQLSGKRFVEIKKRERRHDEKKEFVADISKISTFWKPKHKFSKGLSITYKWLDSTLMKNSE